MMTPHPRWRTHSIFHNIPWLRETYQQEITISARDARRAASSPATSSRCGTTAAGWSCRPT
jgi:hypothetical protein